MKINRELIKEIIKEELENLLEDPDDLLGATTAPAASSGGSDDDLLGATTAPSAKSAGGNDDLLGATNAPAKAVKTLDARMDKVEAIIKQLVARLKK